VLGKIGFLMNKKNRMTLKQKIYSHFLQLINEKIAIHQKTLADLKESGANETKSTAGDKHETALAMLQIEQANVRGQLQEAVLQKTILEKINPALSPNIIVNGSLVKTSRGYFFLSTALAKATIEQILVMPLSPQSPLGCMLMGLKTGEVAILNNNCYTIEHIE
jgi:hypothetical protein